MTHAEFIQLKQDANFARRLAKQEGREFKLGHYYDELARNRGYLHWNDLRADVDGLDERIQD